MVTDGRRKGQFPRFQAFPALARAVVRKRFAGGATTGFLINLEILGFSTSLHLYLLYLLATRDSLTRTAARHVQSVRGSNCPRTLRGCRLSYPASSISPMFLQLGRPALI
jgi:hypothetical protein